MTSWSQWVLGCVWLFFFWSSQFCCVLSFDDVFNATKADFDKLVLGDQSAHLWWLVQITDIHLNSVPDYTTITNLKSFVGEALPAIRPFAVLVTGDITNAVIRRHYPRSGQQLSEWRRYRNIVRSYYNDLLKNQSSRFPVWLDTRGNHDSFDVPSMQHYQNLFSAYSLMNNASLPVTFSDAVLIQKERLAVCQLTVDGQNYGIVMVDAAQTPGLRGPYNYFGSLSSNDLEEMRNIDESMNSNRFTVWAGHYPTSSILSGSSHRIMGNVIRHGAVYLCGHYHNLRSVEHHCYAKHLSGQIELELADFKRQASYRILAVDHGLFSFVDEELGKWPVVLVTNPKPAKYVMPGYEPIAKILQSTHIRLLVFSPHGVDYVQISLNGKPLGNAVQNPDEPALYTLPWDPSSLQMNIMHTLGVSAVDKQGNVNTRVKVEFYVKPSPYMLSQYGVTLPPTGGFFAQTVLLGNYGQSIEGAFYCLTIALAIGLLLLRYFRSRIRPCPTLYKTPAAYVSPDKEFGVFAFNMFLAIYPAVGPLFVGEMMSECYGVAMPVGVLLFDGRYLPEPSLAFQGIWHHLLFTIPVIIYFFLTTSNSSIVQNRRSCSKRFYLVNRGLFILIVFFQLKRAYFISLAYGWLAILTNIPRFWMVVLFIYVDLFFLRKHSSVVAVSIFDI